MGEGPIPFSAIMRYAECYGIDTVNEFERFRKLIRGMDSEYLKFRAQQLDKTKEKPFEASVTDVEGVAAIFRGIAINKAHLANDEKPESP